MTVSETLDAAVEALHRDLTATPGLYERRVFADSRHSLYVAVSKPGNLNNLFVIVKHGSVRSQCEFDTKGFRVRVEPFGDRGQVRIRLEEAQRGFNDLFRQLRNDIVAAILPCVDENQAFDALRSRLVHWQRFMERAGEGLPPTRQVGLYGELCFLYGLIAAGCSHSKALDGWRGPLAANHDFMFGATAVEVKSTVSNITSRVQIANERQLDNTGVENLFLCHLSLDRREHAGQTLPVLVEIVRGVLEEALQVTYGDLLLAAGYHPAQAELYGDVGYTERQTTYYRVGEHFPRVVPADLRSGVQEVSYAVELTGATPFLVSADVVVASII